MKRQTFAASAIVMALAVPALAENSKPKGHGNSAPPSRNELAPVAVVTPVVSATPLAWIDDATLLDPNTMVLSLSAVRWQGAGLSEVDFPISDVAMGLARRVQLSASVPRVIGSADPGGAAGGVGTSFFSFKIDVASNRARTMKLAVAPTMQLLGEAVAATLGPNQSRVRWGLPMSAEIDRGPLRLYGGGGYFSPGLWYTGAAFGLQTSPKVTINGGFSRAWRGANGLDIPLSDRDRKEISGGAAYSLTPHLTAFGSIGTTVKTFADNGAGTTLSGGVSFWFATIH